MAKENFHETFVYFAHRFRNPSSTNSCASKVKFGTHNYVPANRVGVIKPSRSLRKIPFSTDYLSQKKYFDTDQQWLFQSMVIDILNYNK